MQTLTDWVLLWWMVIAFYQFFDYVTDELIYTEHKGKALLNIGMALVVIPTFPIMKIFSTVVTRMIRVEIDETIEQED